MVVRLPGAATGWTGVCRPRANERDQPRHPNRHWRKHHAAVTKLTISAHVSSSSGATEHCRSLSASFPMSSRSFPAVRGKGELKACRNARADVSMWKCSGNVRTICGLAAAAAIIAAWLARAEDTFSRSMRISGTPSGTESFEEIQCRRLGT
jgi:hypothetical protein